MNIHAYVAQFMYDYENNVLDKMFSHNRDVNLNHDTRHSYRTYQPRFTCRFSNNLPLHAFPRIWNKWNHNYNVIQTKNKLKRLVKDNLINKYNIITYCNNPYCKDCTQ